MRLGRAVESDVIPTAASWLAFAALCVGMFMAVLDIQIVATALPTIQEALSVRPDHMSWIQTSYLIAEIIAIPLTGILTRALTMRWLAVTTLALFTVASVGCALSGSFAELLFWRTVQGFFGGLLIPQVFSAGFVLFPGRGQGLATTLAGVLAVLAPAVGPYIGGWITFHYDWPWLFLINIGPGLAAILVAAALLPRERAEPVLLRRLDFLSLIAMAASLASLEIGLKEAPQAGWSAPYVLALFAASIAAGAFFILRTLGSRNPLVQLRIFADRNFATGALLSFVLGAGLYSSVYLMPVFLAFVRSHDALGIGEIMIVTGLTQLLFAPLAVALEQRANAKLLTTLGFAFFAIGLGASAFQTRATDGDEMFWPQVVRGAAVLFCILPPIRLAIGMLPQSEVPNASGLFNLMRNLGGAIGLALIDTVIYGRGPVIGEAYGEALRRGDVEAAKAVGLPLDKFTAHIPGAAVDPSVEAYVRSAVERQATVEAINEAWAMLSLLMLAGLVAVWVFAWRRRASGERSASTPESIG